MTTDEVKEFLKGYNNAKRRYQLAIENLEEYETRLMRVTPDYSREKVSSSPEPDKISNSIDTLITLRQRMIDCADTCNREMEKVLNVIMKIDDVTMYEVINRRYILGETWEHIAVKMNYSWQHIHKLHAKALRKVAIECEGYSDI